LGSNAEGGKRFSPPKSSILAPGPTLLLTEWGPVFFPGAKGAGGLKLTTHLLLRLRMGETVLLFSLYTLMSWTGTVAPFHLPLKEE